MPPLPTYGKTPVVLLTNDDGPPSDHSPNIYAFAKLLKKTLGWDVRVVVPDSQKSWVGKGYSISQIIEAKFFYPLEPDGLTGEITHKRRPLKDGETMEWVLLSGTPASCTNIAVHNLYPGEIDLVISGPNHGRNSSTAFALSSGTIGAALGGALSVPIAGPPNSTTPSLHRYNMPSIAVSYGVVKRPVTPRTLELAHDVGVDVCKRLFDDWGYEDAARQRPVQVYNVNVPLVEEALEPSARRVCFTTLWRNTYGQLFVATQKPPATAEGWNPSDDVEQSAAGAATPVGLPDDGVLRFSFEPNLHPVLFPDITTIPEGTDAWAFYHGYTSVSPIRAEFAGLEDGHAFGSGNPSDSFW